MSEIDDGGSAFPSTREEIEDGALYRVTATGMSLRDWFAGQALAAIFGRALLTSEGAESIDAIAKQTKENGGNTIAAACYNVADAMLKMRETE